MSTWELLVLLFYFLFLIFGKIPYSPKYINHFLTEQNQEKQHPGGQTPQALTPFPNQMTDLEATSKLRKQLAVTCTMTGEIFPTSVLKENKRKGSIIFPKWNLTVEVEFTLFTYDFFATCEKLVNLIKLIFMFVLTFPHLFSGVGRIKHF